MEGQRICRPYFYVNRGLFYLLLLKRKERHLIHIYTQNVPPKYVFFVENEIVINIGKYNKNYIPF